MLGRVTAPIAASFDRLVARAITGRSASARGRSRAESLGHEERVRALTAIDELYGKAGLDDIDGFFGPALPAEPRLTTVGAMSLAKGKATIRDARWPSRVATFCPDLTERFAATRENHEAAARLYLGDGTHRPAAILIHGYRGGHHALEERVWPIRWLCDRGVDVATFVLPFHGCRAQPGSGPRFPSSDPRFTNEAFRQAIGDLRALVSFFELRGARAVGAMGMSLGGFTASLLATVEPRLAFVVPIIPLCSFADVALAAGRLVGSEEEQRLQHALLERAHRVVSPVARPSRVPANASLVVAGQADRITPIEHAKRIATHMGAELVSFPGGHLLQFGRADGFRAVGRMLKNRGIFA